MKVFLTQIEGGTVQVMARPEGPGVFGDLVVLVGEGEAQPTFLGWTAAELKAMGEGEHELSEKPTESGGAKASAEEWQETQARKEKLAALTGEQT